MFPHRVSSASSDTTLATALHAATVLHHVTSNIRNKISSAKSGAVMILSITSATLRINTNLPAARLRLCRLTGLSIHCRQPHGAGVMLLLKPLTAATIIIPIHQQTEIIFSDVLAATADIGSFPSRATLGWNKLWGREGGCPPQISVQWGEARPLPPPPNFRSRHCLWCD